MHRAFAGYLFEALTLFIVKIANDLEHIGDQVATGMVTSARKRLDENVEISPTTAAVIAGLHHEVVEAFDGVMQALEAQDAERAAEVRQMKAGFTALVEDIAGHEVDRLRADEPRRLNTYAREIELTETLDDIFKIVRRIARTEMAIFNKSANSRKNSAA